MNEEKTVKRATVVQRLILLTAIPVTALILFSCTLIWDSFGRYQSAVQAHDIMEVAVAAGNLIHPMQIERGMTAGFIQSNGQRFAEVLPGARAKTNEKLVAYGQLIDGIDTGQMPRLKKAAEEAQHKLDELAKTREHANRYGIPAGEASAYFTGSIASILEVMSTAATYNSNSEITQKLMGYHNFVNAKETAGQERALSMPVFVSNKIEPAQFRAILEKINKQEAYLDSFTDSASEQEKAALKAVLDDEAAQDVQRMRVTMVKMSERSQETAPGSPAATVRKKENAAADRPAESGASVDPAVWFKRITDKINGFHEVEQLLTKNINNDVNHQLSASRTLLLAQLILAVLAIAVTMAVSVWVARSVNRPLKAVVDAAGHVVEHDDFTYAIPKGGTQETASVGQAINRMTEKFRNIISDIRSSSTGIADASSVLATSSGQVSKGSSAQSDAAASVAAVIEEVSVSVSETAANAHTAGEIVEKSRAGTENALAVMTETVQNVNGIAALIRESDTNVVRLDEKSKEIDGIIQMIKDVADQTNLLALNAAIEAARAGEQGRGFAVVADEVRKLAERTSGATVEITSLIGDIQGHIDKTVAGMRQATTQVEKSLELVGRTESALRHIGNDSREASSNVQSIVDAVREQDIAIQQVATSIENIARMSEENSAAAASSNKMAAQLDKLASTLMESAARFRV